MAPAFVQQVSNDADVPVYEGIACQDHPAAELADLLGGDTSPATTGASCCRQYF